MSNPDSPLRITLKLARALKHLHNAKAEIDTIVNSDDCRVVPDFKSERGYLVVKVYMPSETPELCSIFMGEAIYQLRSALDHLACYLTERNGNAIDDATEFPIFDRREKFLDQFGRLTPGLVRRIGGMSTADQALIQGEQPFQGKYGATHADPLWWLYELARFDRHKFPHFTNFATLGGADVFEPQWFIDRYFTQVSSNYGNGFVGEAEVSRWRIDPAAYEVSPQVAVKVKSNVTFGIAFDKVGPSAALPVAGAPVVTILKDVGERVTKLIGLFLT